VSITRLCQQPEIGSRASRGDIFLPIQVIGSAFPDLQGAHLSSTAGQPLRTWLLGHLPALLTRNTAADGRFQR
jgi:hypothetical protein